MLRNVDIYKVKGSRTGRRVIVDKGAEVPQAAIARYGQVEFEKTRNLHERGLIGVDAAATIAKLDSDGWTTWPL